MERKLLAKHLKKDLCVLVVEGRFFTSQGQQRILNKDPSDKFEIGEDYLADEVRYSVIVHTGRGQRRVYNYGSPKQTYAD